jgi:PAS domain S-box-containing protein
MGIKTKILFVEHDPNDIELMQYELKKGGLHFISEVVQNEQDYEKALKNFIPDIILSDFSLPSFDGRTAFKMKEQMAPDTPFIFVSGNIGEENSIEYIKSGVTDYALKDKLFTLTTKVKRALKDANDIAEKREAEKQKEFERNNLTSLINNTNDLMWSVDTDFNLITSNRRFDELATLMTGKAIVKGENILEAGYSPELLRNHKKLYNRAFAGESFTEIEYTDNPVEFWSEIWYYPIRKGDEVIGTACYSRDITQLKLAELERIRITNDLIQRNKDLEQFAYIVSHNLRAPLANIIGITEVIHSRKLDTEAEKKMSDYLGTSVKKIDEVINDLNDILQVKQGVGEKKELVRFSELLADIQLSIDNLIRKEDVQFVSNFRDVDEMQTLKSYLYSIFFNLISNSIKYRSPHIPPLIEISSRRSENKIKLHFKDNGLGIDLVKRGDQVFGLYKRFHTHTEGKGMGLYMVKTQVETLGGEISVQSEVNKGTEFSIVFDSERKAFG